MDKLFCNVAKTLRDERLCQMRQDIHDLQSLLVSDTRMLEYPILTFLHSEIKKEYLIEYFDYKEKEKILFSYLYQGICINDPPKSSVVQFFINRGVNIHYKSQQGLTFLHALCGNHTENKMSDIVTRNYVNDDEYKIIEYQLISITRMLIDAGIDINSLDNNGRTALSYLIEYNSNQFGSLTTFLIKSGADTRKKGTLGYSWEDILYKTRMRLYGFLHPYNCDPVECEECE